MGVRTTKPISTISFNTVDFLKVKLNELVKAGILQFWALIEHKPEDDEGGKKQHIHLYLEPAKILQTEDLKKEFIELVPGEDMPRKCIGIVSSKFDDWYMYGLHDKRYLASKGQSRRYAYSSDHFQSCDSDELLFRVHRIDLLSLSPYADMQDAIQQGLTWEEYFSRGVVPLPQIRQFHEAWNSLLSVHTFRNGRPGHIDYDTGEISDS